MVIRLKPFFIKGGIQNNHILLTESLADDSVDCVEVPHLRGRLPYRSAVEFFIELGASGLCLVADQHCLFCSSGHSYAPHDSFDVLVDPYIFD
jgi:hypothetical protein